jgi:hypothetical protein
VYDQVERELLILGEPGTGKSTLLLDLAQRLVEGAEGNAASPLPILLPLSSWAVERSPLQDWIVEQLSQIYDVPRHVSEQWVQEEALLPLLDGLDEMEETARPACISAINAYHQAHFGPLVVCSRKTEYEAAAVQQRLILQSAVVVQKLSHEQIESYLIQAGKHLEALHRSLKKNAVLRDLATTPLMLSILMLTYRGTTLQELPRKAALLYQQIWTDYIKRMVESKGKRGRYALPKTCSWLGWLARRMRERNQTVFYLEHLQPDWLTRSEQHPFLISAVRLPTIVIGLLVTLLVQAFFADPASPYALGSLLRYGAMGGFLGWLWSRPVQQEHILAPRKRTRAHTWIMPLAVSVLVGLLIGLSFEGNLSPDYPSGDWLRDALPSGVLLGLNSLLLQHLFMRESRRSVPALSGLSQRGQRFVHFLQSVYIRRTVQVYITTGLSIGLSSGLSYGLSYGLSQGLSVGVGVGLSAGLSFGLVSALIGLTVGAQTGDIRLTEHLRWTWKSLRKGLFISKHLRGTLFLVCLVTVLSALSSGLSEALYIGLGSGFYYPLSYGLSFGLSYGLSYGLSIGLSYWFLFGLFQGVSQERIEDQDRRVANQGIRRSFQNSMVMSILSGGIIGVIGIFSAWLSEALNAGLNTGAVEAIGGTGLTLPLSQALSDGLSAGLSIKLNAGLSTGLLIGVGGGCFVFLLSGGLSVLRHYLIRFLLWQSRAFPWQAVSFLNDAMARVLLRRVGGGYSFTHRLLLDHFADLHTDAVSAPTAVPPTPSRSPG